MNPIVPQLPTIVIKIMPNGQLHFTGPDDKMLALSMLSIARALTERELLQPAQIIPIGEMPPPPPMNGRPN